MKKSFIVSATIIFSLSLTSCQKEKLIAENDSPSEIKSYVSTHFPAQSISQIVKDKDGFQVTYDVILNDLTMLEFNRKKEIIDIDREVQLPNSVIPSKILDYVNINYAANHIVGWEIDDKRQRVTLNSNLELEFKMNGDFLRIDN